MKQWLFLFLLLGAALSSRAQQIVCERTQQWPAGQQGYVVTDLLQLRPDSLRLLGDYQAGTQAGLYPTTTSLRRLQLNACDTLRGMAYQAQALLTSSSAIVTRRGQVLLANSSVSATNFPVLLRLVSRAGQTQWTRTINLDPVGQEAGGLLEAPDRGFFVAVRTMRKAYLVRLDSMGNILWQRQIGRSATPSLDMFAPVYTRAGSLLFHCFYNKNGIPTTGVIEVSQNGDSLTARQTAPDPQQWSDFNYNNKGSLVPLRDGGFLVTATIDSAGKGYFRPFLTRLDRNLNVVWSTTYRAQATKEYFFAHPYELADGSLVVAVTYAASGYAGPYWLFRYSATGVLLQRYQFTSPLLVSLHQAGQGSRDPSLAAPPGFQPLSDSTFMLAGNLGRYSGNSAIPSIYLAHLKVPGLRRVIDSHYIPATNSPLAAHPPAPAWPGLAYPNPATATVTVPYRLPPGSGAGRLLLTDLAGRRVLAQPVAAGAAPATLAVGGLAAGLYLLTLEVPGQPPATQRLAVGP